MNELVRLLSRAVMWRVVGRMMRGRSAGFVALLGVVAAVAFLVTAR